MKKSRFLSFCMGLVLIFFVAFPATLDAINLPVA